MQRGDAGPRSSRGRPRVPGRNFRLDTAGRGFSSPISYRPGAGSAPAPRIRRADLGAEAIRGDDEVADKVPVARLLDGRGDGEHDGIRRDSGHRRPRPSGGEGPPAEREVGPGTPFVMTSHACHQRWQWIETGTVIITIAVPTPPKDALVSALPGSASKCNIKSTCNPFIKKVLVKI